MKKLLFVFLLFYFNQVLGESTYLLSCKYRSQVKFNYLFTRYSRPDDRMIRVVNDTFDIRVPSEPIVIQVVLFHVAKRPGKYVIYGDETVNVPHILLIFTVDELGKTDILYYTFHQTNYVFKASEIYFT